jgi:hypothetical protein
MNTGGRLASLMAPAACVEMPLSRARASVVPHPFTVRFGVLLISETGWPKRHKRPVDKGFTMNLNVCRRGVTAS